jgi:Zn-dependent protease with chaperone function
MSATPGPPAPTAAGPHAGDPAAPPRPPRVSFFDEQAYRRRRARWLSVTCLIIASGIGIVLSTVVTPLLLLIGGGALRLLARAGISPPATADAARQLGRWAAHHLETFSGLIDSLDKINRLSDLSITLAPLWRLSTVCLPALVAAGAVWCLARIIFMRVAGQDLVVRLKARAPDPSDREERQLANIVEEIAIAAGLPPPRLLLIDSPAVNAATIGRSHANATILVTRGLLDQLDRQQTSGIVAHQIAAITQGDVGVTTSILAVFQTFGFFLTILDLPFRRSAWRALGGFLLCVLAIRRSPVAIARTGELIEEALTAESLVDVDRIMARIRFPRLRLVLIAPLLPPLLLTTFFKLVLFLWTSLFLGPPLAMLFRNRRLAADALAVQLTRDPEALAGALERIAGPSLPGADAGLPGGAETREYFFIHAPLIVGRRTVADRRAITQSLHPMIGRRLARLVALGAAPRAGTNWRWRNLIQLRRQPLLGGLVIFLLLLLIPLGITLVVMIAYITAFVMTMALAAGLTVVTAVLGT